MLLARAPLTLIAFLASEVPDDALSETCHPGRWVLDGAATLPGDDAATFSPAWVPALDQVAECMRLDSSRGACIQVQGRYDERTFSDEVVAAFGSVRATQVARARGRAGRAISELYGRGVPPSRMRELPPPDKPTYRGVELVLIPACVAESSEVVVVLPATAGEARSKQGEFGSAGELVSPAAESDAPSMFWVEAGADMSMLVAPDRVFAPIVRLGVGWHIPWVYARLNTGFGVATAAEQRTSFEISGAAGAVPLEWLEVGLIGGHRTGSSSPVEPWLEQVWFLGIEANECVFELSDSLTLCLSQSVVPIGARLRRAEVTDGNIERIQPTRQAAVRFDLAATLRADL